MRVLLIKPNYPDIYGYGPRLSICFPPLGLEYIAAYIEDIAEVHIIDHRQDTVNLKHIEDIISQLQPDYVGISCNYTYQVYIARRLANIAKKFGSRTVLGGWHPTLAPNETLEFQSVDIVVRGEGEMTFRELIQKNSPVGILGLSYKQDGKLIHNPDRELMNLKQVRKPLRRFRSATVKGTYGFFGFPVDCIETSRGCPFTCNFCCIHHVYRNTYRQRNVQDVLEELNSKEIKNRASLIYIVDDNFVVDRKFVMELCEVIIKSGINKYFMAQARVDMIVNHPEIFKKMAEAGFIYLFLGLESYSNRTLKKLNKRIKFEQIKSALRILHDFGYIIQGNIILGANLEDTKQDLEFAIEITKKLDIDIPTFSLLTPFPNTTLMEHVLKENLLLTRDWSNFNWSVPVIKYSHISSDDFNYYLNKAYNEMRFFKNPLQRIKKLYQSRGLKFYLSRMSPIILFKVIPQMLKNLLKSGSKK